MTAAMSIVYIAFSTMCAGADPPLRIIHPDLLEPIRGFRDEEMGPILGFDVSNTPTSDDIAEYFSVDEHLFQRWRAMQSSALQTRIDSAESTLEVFEPILNRALFGLPGVEVLVRSARLSSVSMNAALRRSLYLMEIACDLRMLDKTNQLPSLNLTRRQRGRRLSRAQIETGYGLAFAEVIARCPEIFNLLRTVATEAGVTLPRLVFHLGRVGLMNRLSWFVMIAKL